MKTELLKLLLVGVAAIVLPAHSPYTQWYAYRAKHLVIVADEARFETATATATAVAVGWPESKAVAAMARSSRDVVSLLRTGQLQVGLLSRTDAADAVEGRGSFAGSAALPLRAIGVVRGDVLVALDSYAPEKVRLIASALGSRATKASPIPLHRGVP